MLEMGMSILMAVMSIVSIVIFIMVLIKQFSRGGVLHGLLGLITCGLYTFIWGWIKHRQYALTKVMTVWSLISVVSMVLPLVFGTTMAMNMLSQIGLPGGDLKAMIKEPGASGAPIRKPVREPVARPADRAADQPAAASQDAAGPPTDPAKLTQAAMAMWQNGRFADPARAIDYWDQVIRLRPDSPEAYNNRGLGYLHAQQYPQAVSDFDHALQLKPDYAVAFNNRGNAYYEMAQYQRAVADFSSCLAMQPAYAKASLNRGLANYRLNQLPQACQDFQNACAQGDCEGIEWATAGGVCN